MGLTLDRKGLTHSQEQLFLPLKEALLGIFLVARLKSAIFAVITKNVKKLQQCAQTWILELAPTSSRIRGLLAFEAVSAGPMGASALEAVRDFVDAVHAPGALGIHRWQKPPAWALGRLFNEEESKNPPPGLLDLEGLST